MAPVVNADEIRDSLNPIADPILYQLVRVEGDGTLVPATDDELMEVEQILQDGKNEIASNGSPSNKDGYVSSELLSSKKSDLDSSEGLSPSEITEVNSQMMNAKLEYVEVMLQKVKQEENLRLSSESFRSSSKYTGVDAQACDVHSSSPDSHNEHQPENTSEKTDFSISKGEICLDKLTIRELQAVFKATFSRETSVKDKSWLRRWIAMGLAGSYDPPIRSCTIEEKTVRKQVKETACRVGRSNQHTEEVTIPVDDKNSDLLPECDHEMEEQNQLSKRVKESVTGIDVDNENLCVEQTTAKRLRKPTRRYIEEHSEVQTRDCTGRVSSSDSTLVHSSTGSVVIPGQHIISHGKNLVTRQDSLGGSSIEIPYVSRVRRGRPRKDYMAFIERRSSQIVARLAKKAIANQASQQEVESGNIVWKDRSRSTRILRQTIVHMEEKSVRASTNDEEEVLTHENVDSSRYSLDDYADTMPVKACIRRKHHRAWTLTEVVKLVEGVARYGTGRWSKIRKLAFASHSYRSSVDLKDKWRNLLKASIAHGPSERENKNSRKYSALPLPTTLLSRVRELAQMETKAGTNFASCKLPGRSRITVLQRGCK